MYARLKRRNLDVVGGNSLLPQASILPNHQPHFQADSEFGQKSQQACVPKDKSPRTLSVASMPSMEETRRSVRQRLERDDQHFQDVDHDALLASLSEQIDRHNAAKDDLRSAMRRSRRRNSTEKRAEEEGSSKDSSLRFRFKSRGENESTQKRRHRSTDSQKNGERGRHHRKHKHKKRTSYPTPPEETSAAHPFPREPTSRDDGDEGLEAAHSPSEAHTNADAAFRASLFDALADDEGAAYWESVYSQPIHTFPRPAVQTENGELEAMSDEAYVAWVKEKMWERKNPEVVWERGRREREKRQVEEEKARRREEFVRRRERAAWERAQTGYGLGDGEDEEGGKTGFEYEFSGSPNLAPTAREEAERTYVQAWTNYLAGWDALKYDLLTHQQQQREPAPDEEQQSQPAPSPASRIPWPILPSQSLTRPNVEAFMRHLPSASSSGVRSRLQLLKAERVRWHPDKVQQRFRGAVDAETMKKVTAVFQVVDGVLEEVRKQPGD